MILSLKKDSLDFSSKDFIIKNFSNPKKRINEKKLDRLIKKYNQDEYIIVREIEEFEIKSHCGDENSLIFIFKRKGKILEKAFFYNDGSICAITGSFSNVLCIWLEDKIINELLENLEELTEVLKSKNYSKLDEKLLIFESFIQLSRNKNSANRVNCILMPLAFAKKALKNLLWKVKN